MGLALYQTNFIRLTFKTNRTFTKIPHFLLRALSKQTKNGSEAKTKNLFMFLYGFPLCSPLMPPHRYQASKIQA